MSKSTANQFKKIVSLAKKQDINALILLLQSGVSINVFYHNQTPISFLAEKGDHAAVLFLYHQLMGSIDSAVEGYARGGLTEKVGELLRNYNAYIGFAAQGYALNGNDNEVENLIQQGASLGDVIQGYARAGHVKKVEEFLKRGASINDAAFGYALGGHTALAKKAIASGAALKCVIEGFAIANNAIEVDRLINNHHDHLVCALEKYAFGGHVKQAKQLLKKHHLPLKSAIWNFARAGNCMEVESLMDIDKSLQRYALYGYACGNYINAVNNLLIGNESEQDFKFAVCGFNARGCFDSEATTQILLMLISNDEVRGKLAEQIKLLVKIEFDPTSLVLELNHAKQVNLFKNKLYPKNSSLFFQEKKISAMLPDPLKSSENLSISSQTI